MPNKRPGVTVTITCQECGQPATVAAYYDYTPTFCSARCSNLFHGRARKSPFDHCTVEGCEKPIYVGAVCQMHHWREKHYGDVNHYRYQKHCNVPGCERPHVKGGFCSLHHQRMKRNGTVVVPGRLLDPKRYRLKKMPDHPLAMRNGRVFVHRAALYDKIGPGGHACHWCGKLVYWDRTYPKHDDGLVVDHLDHNRHHNTAENLVPSCNRCNSQRRRKGALTPHPLTAAIIPDELGNG